MAKKRTSKARDRRRRRRERRGGATAVLILLCLLIGTVAVITAMTIFFKIDRIELTGQTRYSKEEIIAASGLERGDNLILFDKFSVKDGIFSACPYLDEVQVRRRPPDGIEIIVTECVPVAAIREGSGGWLIDREGKLLEKVSNAEASGHTVLYGVELNQPKSGQYAEFLQKDLQKPVFLLLNTALDDGILKDIGGMDFSQQYDIRFRYKERFEVRLGTTEELDRKLRYLHLIIEEKLSTNAKGTLDLSDTQKARFIPAAD